MGLTIHYDLKVKKGTNVRGLLERARLFAQNELHPAELSEVKHFDSEEFKQHRNDRESEWFWASIQAGGRVKLDRGSSAYVDPLQVTMFRMWPGANCEEANIGFATFPTTIDNRGDTVKTKLTGLRWHSFCKTTYADDFLKCHLMVIAMLDWLDDNGVKVTVSDEGDYWETRNLKALASGHGDDLSMLAAFAGALTDGLGVGVVAPILERPDFEHLEMAGIEKYGKMTDSTLAVLNALRRSAA
jgi:hypothetical protein